MRPWIALTALALGLPLVACAKPNDGAYQGWVEADIVFVSPDETGRIETLSVREGDTVTVGAPLFTVDDALQKADVAQNQATLVNAKQAFARAEQLLKTKTGTQATYDSAEAALRSAEARMNSSRTRLARRQVASPVGGSVQQVYYRAGEMVPPGRPVIALLPPANVKVRFYVPEALLPTIKIGDGVAIRCDGCPGDLTANVSFIARSAEYTPPVIYSQEERSKLVFLIEARPNRPDALRVGQPVSIAFANGAKQ